MGCDFHQNEEGSETNGAAPILSLSDHLGETDLQTAVKSEPGKSSNAKSIPFSSIMIDSDNLSFLRSNIHIRILLFSIR